MRAMYQICGMIVLASVIMKVDGFFNAIVSKLFPMVPQVQVIESATKQSELSLLKILENTDVVTGRGAKLSAETLSEIESAILYLENSKSIPNPTDSEALDGCWKLLYTSSPGTNSPIQRTFTSFDGVSVYQILNTKNTKNSFLPDGVPDVSNTVCFGNNARLRVTAIASTMSNPIVVPRVGDGKIFGFNIFGISSSREPRDPSERIDFAFQEARFEFRNSAFSIPYPVPFKLLGDEAKGWLDITYLSEDLRIARGNKGTIFVLRKSDTSADPTAAFAAQIDLNDGPSSAVTTTNNAEAASGGVKSSSPVLTTTKNVLSKDLSMKTKTTPIVKAKKSKKSEKKPVVIVFPAQLGTEGDYEELSRDISVAVGLKAYTAPLSRLDWPIGLIPSLVTKEYITGNLLPSKTLGFYLKKVDEAVSTALEEDPEAEFVLLAHSIGGWIARVWLSEWTTPERRARVRKIVTLGSPHNPPPADSAVAKIDQTRGLLKYITENFPGAYDQSVEYISIIGTGVTGSLTGKGKSSESVSVSSGSEVSVKVKKGSMGRVAVAAGGMEGISASTGVSADEDRVKESGGDSVSLSDRFQSIVAFSSYSVLSGEGEGVLGDGVIPYACAELSGAEIISLEGTKHSNFLPTPGKSLRLPLVWYGSEGVLEQWVQRLL